MPLSRQTKIAFVTGTRRSRGSTQLRRPPGALHSGLYGARPHPLGGGLSFSLPARLSPGDPTRLTVLKGALSASSRARIILRARSTKRRGTRPASLSRSRHSHYGRTVRSPVITV